MTNPTNNLAKNLTDAYDICDPVKPLQGDDLDKYYIPLLEARKTEAIVQVGRWNYPNPYLCFAKFCSSLSTHKG